MLTDQEVAAIKIAMSATIQTYASIKERDGETLATRNLQNAISEMGAALANAEDREAA